MWRFLGMFWKCRGRDATQKKQRGPGIPQISVGELVTLCHRASNRLMIFDLREPAEIEGHPYTIPGALLTINVDLYELMRWIPQDTIVVLYSTVDTPAYYARIHLSSTKLRFYALEGGVRLWHDAGQRLERAVLNDWRSVNMT
jgi:hypothetical protein